VVSRIEAMRIYPNENSEKLNWVLKKHMLESKNGESVETYFIVCATLPCASQVPAPSGLLTAD